MIETIFNREHIDRAVFDPSHPPVTKPGDVVVKADDDIQIIGEVPNMDLFPVVRERETWVDAQARIWGDSEFMCEDVLRNLLNGALTVAMTHCELLVLPEAMDAIRAMMGTKRI